MPHATCGYSKKGILKRGWTGLHDTHWVPYVTKHVKRGWRHESNNPKISPKDYSYYSLLYEKTHKIETKKECSLKVWSMGTRESAAWTGGFLWVPDLVQPLKCIWINEISHHSAHVFPAFIFLLYSILSWNLKSVWFFSVKSVESNNRWILVLEGTGD